jgi:pimeloyl-ACP methyl ester carboxylesterase
MKVQLLALALLGLMACDSKPRVSPEPPAPRAIAAPEPAGAPPPPPAPPPPARVERMLVPGDLPASIVRGAGDSPPLTVFMPGVCSNGNAYLQTFPEAARRHGGAVAIEGDQPCGVKGFRTFSWDAGRQHARVEAALAAAGLAEIPREGITLVGYSQGAALAEQMAARWPERYARVVLIGAPTDPAARSFTRARGLVTMSCDRDVPARMKQAAQAALRSGTPALYLGMPGCTHGNVADAERVFDEAFDWLREHERPLAPSATSVRLTGVVA